MWVLELKILSMHLPTAYGKSAERRFNLENICAHNSKLFLRGIMFFKVVMVTFSISKSGGLIIFLVNVLFPN